MECKRRKYDVDVLRMWSQGDETVQEEDGLLFERNTEKHFPAFEKKANGEFFAWKMGTIDGLWSSSSQNDDKLQLRDQKLRFWNQGGDDNWFSGWGISHVEICPIF